ncbi:sodium/potassium/calcium exchanger 6 [Plakobranchus ocellatus]|uniref:Sodium/potassium/calcium exchanger 6 n=1 Tax=Plakobranchus ocellatus TaxID=259542 RepID=A0AAV4C981_9GAST|nr:sodium/potassium/calcium exchanger 6 [Plakobranchus ocellatus]
MAGLLLDDDSDIDCHELHHLPNGTSICHFVKTTSSCGIDEGYINYTQLLYCGFSAVPIWFGCVLLLIWWLFMFSGLAVTADDFFCPSLAVISRSLKLSHNVAISFMY